MEITIWVEDEYTGSKVNAEKKGITTRDEALRLMGVAWDVMQEVGRDPGSEVQFIIEQG